MRFHVLTLFPQMILDGLNTSITGRAIQNGILSVDAVNIRDFAENKYMKRGRLSVWRRCRTGYAAGTCLLRV